MAGKGPPAPERNLQRKRVLMSATLYTRDGAQRVRVRDLTAVGAQLQLDSSVSPGSDAIFKRGSLFAAAHVAWSQELSAGIRFYRPLSQFDWAECGDESVTSTQSADGALILAGMETPRLIAG